VGSVVGRDGFGMNNANGETQISNKYLKDEIIMEVKDLNAPVKTKHLDDFTNDLKAHDHIRLNNKFNHHLSAKDATKRGNEMQK